MYTRMTVALLGAIFLSVGCTAGEAGKGDSEVLTRIVVSETATGAVSAIARE